MGLLGKIKNKVHQGILGAKDAFVKTAEFIKDNGLTPYMMAGAIAHAIDFPLAEAMPMILPPILVHKMFKHKEEMNKQEEDRNRIREVQNLFDGIRLPLNDDNNQ